MSNFPQSGVSVVAQGVGQFLGDIGRAQKAVGDFGDASGRVSSGYSAMGQVVTGALREIGAIATQALASAGVAVAGFVGGSLKAAGDVEETLNVLQVAGQATDTQMAAVSERAKQLGADLTLPSTSAADAAGAMLELTKAGFSVDQSMAAAKGTLQLAAAAETDAATAAQVLSGAINAFNLEASDAGRITDILAGAANESKANIADLSQGFNQAAFAFGATDQSAEDLATSLAILTREGLTGSDAGTALKNAFMRLMDPTEKATKEMARVGFAAYDANGNMKPLPQLLREIGQATNGMTKEQRDAWLGTVFLSDGMKAIIPLLDEQEAGFLATREAVTRQGQAAELAAAKMKGWNGASQAVSSQLETLQLIIGQKLLPLLTPLAFKLAELIGIASKFAEGGMSFDALTSLGMFLSDFNPQLGSFVSNLAIATDPLQALKDGVLAFLQDAIAQLPGQLTSLGSMLAASAKLWGDKLKEWIADAGPGMLENLGTFVSDLLGGILEAAPGIISQLTEWRGAFLQWILDAMPGMGQNFATFLQGLLTKVGEALPDIVSALAKYADEFVQWITKAAPVFLRELGSFVASMLGYLVDNLPAIVSQLAEWGAQFVAWVVEAVPPLMVEMGNLVADLLKFIVQKAPDVLKKLGEWGEQFKAWAPGALTKLGEALSDLWKKFSGWISEKVKALQEDGSVGKALIDGIKSGINGAINGLVEAAKKAAQAAIDAVKRTLKIESPSKIGIELGGFFSEGVALGVAGGTGMVANAGAGLVAPLAQPGAAYTTNTYNNGQASFAFNGADLGAVQRIVRAELATAGVRVDARKRS
jgi:TP901 family phage tail tape measure protein